MKTFILIALLFTGCNVEKREETTTIYEPNLQSIFDETCGSIEPECRKDMCIESVAAWYYTNQMRPNNITGVY